MFGDWKGFSLIGCFLSPTISEGKLIRVFPPAETPQEFCEMKILDEPAISSFGDNTLFDQGRAQTPKDDRLNMAIDPITREQIRIDYSGVFVPKKYF